MSISYTGEKRPWIPASATMRDKITRCIHVTLLVIVSATAFSLTLGLYGVPFYELSFNDNYSFLSIFSSPNKTPLAEVVARCPQTDVLTPIKNAALWHQIGDEISTEKFKLKAASLLSGAVRIPTESYDTMDLVGIDPRWEVFGLFHDYLAEVFPLIHQTLSLAKINKYGLLYEWTGTDSSLKPIMFAAHQDVVPVDPKTFEEWTHPPYSGFFDGIRIWGRGSSDDKRGLIGVMSAVETLIKSGFKPSRTVVLAFGFDEEASGLQGAYELGKAMLGIYGEDAFSMIVDEGGGFSEHYGTIFALPGIAERGYLDTQIDIASRGGHSSVPPPHTSIGILSAFLTHIENNPYPLELTTSTPMYDFLQCQAVHGKTISRSLRRSIQRSSHSKAAMREVEKVIFKDPLWRAMIGTTQAIDLIGGGVKTNALPENAWAIVNHRIGPMSSVAETQDHDTKILLSLAKEFNLTYFAFGKTIIAASDDAPSAGNLTLSNAFGYALESAPITPTDFSRGEAEPYKMLSGTIKATYNAHRGMGMENSDIKVAPGMPTGNTDTQYYWKLSKHIFRYNHENSGPNVRFGIHTVNESCDIDAFLEMIRFFVTLILNADESNAI